MYLRLIGKIPHARDLRLSNEVGESKCMSTQIPYYAWRSCKSIQKRINDGKINLKSFDNPILTENYLVSMEKRWSSSGIFFRTSDIGDPPQDPKRLERSEHIEPDRFFQGRMIFTSMFNDIDWTHRGNSEKCMSNSEQVQNYGKKFSRGDSSFFWPGNEEKLYGT